MTNTNCSDCCNLRFASDVNINDDPGHSRFVSYCHENRIEYKERLLSKDESKTCPAFCNR